MPNDIAKLSRVMRQANRMVNQRPANGNRSYALRVAHKIDDIRQDLQNGFVRFAYWKMDRTLREALGTLSPHLIPAEKMPKKEKTEKDIEQQEKRDSLGLINYYDLDKDEWRSFFSILKCVLSRPCTPITSKCRVCSCSTKHAGYA